MADNVEIQGLEFQIVNDSTQAVAGLQNLINTLNRLKTATNGGATGLSKTAQSIRELSNSLKGLNSGDASQKITRLANALTALSRVGNVKISSSIANQLTAINTALTGLKWTDGDKLTALANGLRPLSELGKANMTTFINQLSKLPKVIEDLEAADIDKFTQQMKDLAAAMKPFADEMQKVSNGFSAFPSRIQKLITTTEQYNNTVRKATTHTGLFGKALGGLKFAAVWQMARKVGSMIGTAITKSNEYQENMNLFTVAMGEYAESALEYGEKVSEVMGIDLSDWIRNQGVFNTLLTGFGDTADRAALMSKNLTQLGYDLSSFFNISVEDSMQKLQSGISGELEPLRRLGYDLSQARLEAVALSLGIDKSVSSMTQAEKAELRYYAIMTQVTAAQGDLARTLEAPANQLRILKAQFEMAARAIGNIFIPALNAILPYAIAVVQVIREIANAIASLFGFEMTEVDYSAITSAGVGAGGLADSLDDAAGAAKKLKQYTAGFDELNVFSPDAASGAGSGAGAGGGSGFDFELPEYEFLSKEVNTKIEEIKKKMEPFVNWLKDNIKQILTTVLIIGAALLAWKLSTTFLSSIQNLKNLSTAGLGIPLTITAGVILSVAGFTLEFDAIKQAIQDGLSGFDFVEIILGGIVGTAGTALLGKGIAAWITKSFAESAVAKAIVAAGGTVAGATLGAAIGGIVAGLPAMFIGIYDSVVNEISVLSASLTAVGGAAAGAGIGAIIGMLGGPIGAGIGALIGLAVGLVTDLVILIVQNWDDITAWFSNLVSWVDTNVIQPVAGFFKGLWKSVSGFFVNLWNDIVSVWNTVAEWFNVNVIAPLTSSFTAFCDWWGTLFYGVWLSIQAVWIVVSSWFSTYVIQPVQSFFQMLGTKIGEFFTSAWTAVSGVWAVVSGWFDANVIAPVSTAFNTVTTAIGTFFSSAWTKVEEVWSTVYTWFSTNVIDPLKEKFSTAWDDIRGAFETAFTAIGNFAKSIFNGVIGSVEWVINRVISGINKLIEGFNSVVTWAAGIVGADWEGLATIQLVTLPRLADGGFVDEGQLFIAREAGAEMVGAIGRKTAVANNDQIVEGITAGVTVANDGVIAAIYALLNAVEDKDMSVSIGDDVIGRSYDRYNRSRGVRVNNGAFSNAY